MLIEGMSHTDHSHAHNHTHRKLVRSLTDEEYHNILAFCCGFPHVELAVETEGMTS